MSTGMWFVVSVPKKEYELGQHSKRNSSTTKSSSKESINKLGAGDVQNNVQELGADETKESALKNSQNNLNGSQTSLPKGSLYSEMVYFVEKRGPLEEMLRDVLVLLGVLDAVWAAEENDNFYQVYFPCDSGEKCDHILRSLTARGIGTVAGSTVAVLPCAVFYQEKGDPEELTGDDYTESEIDTDDTNIPAKKEKVQGGKAMKGFRLMQKQFLKSVTARLTVAQVVESVRAGTQLTFDYIMFVALASMIAALGLMENSSVVIVASMLISPLMGPILAGTFGAAIRDRNLLSLGMKAELIGLFVCNCIGFLAGLFCGTFSEEWGPIPFPTPEMSGRGQGRSLWVGVLIALPSGAGVALSVLGGNAGSLVGVAISASLLPPAVNAGLLWGLALVKHIESFSAGNVWFEIEPGKDIEINEALRPHKDYTTAFNIEMDKECAILGVISLLLTIVNIICIVLSAMLVLKIKEVAPNTGLATTNRFWKQDIKIARDYNKTVGHKEGKEMGKHFLAEWANLNGMNASQVISNTKESQMSQYQTLKGILQDAEEDDVYQSVMCYVPGNRTNLTRRMTMAGWPIKSRLGNDVVKSATLSPLKRAIFNRKGETLKRKVERKGSASAASPPSIQINVDDPDLEGVQLRNPSALSPATTKVSSLLRRSLQSAGSPAYSYWPTRNRFRRLTNNRFIVTPVEEPHVPPLPPRFRHTKTLSQVESNI